MQAEAGGEINPRRTRPLPLKTQAASADGGADMSIVQSTPGGSLMPAATANFDGMHNPLNGKTYYPPDTEGTIGYDPGTGKKYYMQFLNVSYEIWDVTNPAAPVSVAGPHLGHTIWSGLSSGLCRGANGDGGDPIVLFDHLANRWFASQLAYGATSNFHECVAVSQTADPTGSWYAYDFLWGSSTLNDYPKFGLWTDCLYFAANGFVMPAGSFNGSEFATFNRSDLYSGASLRWAIGYLADTSDAFTMIPSNLRGSSPESLPPAGTPNYFVSESQATFDFLVRKYTPGANCGGGGILGAPTPVSQTAYSWPPGLVSQPGTAQGLDTLSDRLMQKVQYRKVGSAESLWVVHTVPSGSTVSSQWAQIDVTGGVVATTPTQQQIFSPDATLNRWMGSIAADKYGNVALGYSTSNGSSPNYPSIAYAGRLATDPLNTLPQTEVQLVAGAGSQTGASRWGDYTAMSVDPVDDCTFWYTNEYYSSQANGTSGNWQTRIGSFRFPTCTSGPTYVALTPVRLLDTRFANGLSGAFASGVARSFQVSGRDGVPANAVAVTGNLTVTDQTAYGLFALGPTSTPVTSTLNFPVGDNRANGVTVALSGSGSLWALYDTGGPGQTSDLVFDVTGYFVP